MVKTDIDVLCIGDLDMDLFISVPTLPGFDQKVSGCNLGQKPGGMSANTALAVARLGGRARLLAVVGDDAAGRAARAELAGNGVDLGFVREMSDTNTFMCIVMLSPSGEKSLIRLESEAYLPTPADLVPAAFDNVRHLHMTYGSPELALQALAMAGDRGIRTSLDLEPPDIRRAPERLADVLELVDTVFLNREAFAEVANALGRPLGLSLLKPGAEIILTLGAAGSRRISRDGALDVQGFHVDAVDTTGAGDCFAGAYVIRRLEGVEPEEALNFANAAAALATLDYGAQGPAPYRSDVDAFYARPAPGKTKPVF